VEVFIIIIIVLFESGPQTYEQDYKKHTSKQIDNVLYVKNTQYMSFEGFYVEMLLVALAQNYASDPTHFERQAYTYTITT